eukprot:3639845-Pyramimonas_sp.AAC.1
MRYLKGMATSVFSAGEIRGQDSVAAAASVMADGFSQLVSSAGVSPQQWVLGGGHWLPASLAHPENDPAVVSRVAERAPFWNRLHFQRICSESFFSWRLTHLL